MTTPLHVIPSSTSDSMSATSASSRTRRPASAAPTRTYSSISTRSMARSAAKTGTGTVPLKQTTLNVAPFTRQVAATEKPSRFLQGGKRKSADGDGDEDSEEGRKRKVVRYSAEEERKVITTTPPGSPKAPVTPVRFIAPSLTAPTPARDILKAGFQADIKEEDEGERTAFVVKPPTPPRMKPRPQLCPSASLHPAAPTTPGKRCLSPNQSEDRSAKRSPAIAEPPSIPSDPTTPNRSVAQEDVHMMSVPRHLAPPTRTTVASPHRALPSISRLNGLASTRPRETVKAPETAGMMPTVPIPFSFNTPRAKALAQHDPSTQTTSLALAVSVPLPKEVMPLPKRATMAPPSRLPVRATKTSLPPLATTASTSTVAGASKPKPSIGLAGRRPVRRVASGPSTTKALAVFDDSATLNSSNKPADPDVPVRRKPSYPSTLGSGPLAQPRARLVSGPIQVPRSFTAPLSSSTIPGDMQVDENNAAGTTMRSVSDPIPRPRSSLASSTSSRREGFSADTSKSLAGLSDALAKLKLKRNIDGMNAKAGPSTVLRQKGPTILATVVDNVNVNTLNTSIPTSSRLSNVHRPRSSIVGADVSMTNDGDRSIAALMSSANGGNRALRGVVAFVDVRTDDGGCAGDIWSDMLRGVGAKVNVRLTSAVTHIIYKAGSPTTLAWYRRQDQEEKPYIVGVGWLLKSKKAGEKLDEAEFTVDISVEDVFQKRRKTMEPKALSALSQFDTPTSLSSISGVSAIRKSMMYAPKISSPLKKGYTRDNFD